MFRWRQPVRIVFAGLIIFSFSPATLAADPFTLFILRMLRDQVISSAIESGVTSSPQASKPASAAAALPAAPLPLPEGQWLKVLNYRVTRYRVTLTGRFV